uniref:DUF772 domain-containing protein n=1 Tax=Heterorhabditis bacteriophora TaxID=37862 RepID=A0A1I7WK22_HETBA
MRWDGNGTDPALFTFDLLSYLVIADYLLCVCGIPAEVRNRLKWGFRLFLGQTADDGANDRFRCPWTASLEDSEQFFLSILQGFLEQRHLPQCSFPTSPSGGEWDNFGSF